MSARTAAFFDIDGTLIDGNSAPMYARYLRRHGRARRRDLVRTAYYLIKYKLNLLDIDKALEQVSGSIRGQNERDVARFCERWYAEMVRAHIVPGMRDVVEMHRSAGHVLALLSSSTSYLALPLARDFAIEHLLVTRLEVVDGAFTGRAISPICYGPGKVHWLERFAREHGVSLSESYFYTDSITDVPVLEVIGRPRIVNPDRLLRREARRRAWPIVDPGHRVTLEN